MAFYRHAADNKQKETMRWARSQTPQNITRTKVIWQKAESLWQVHPTPPLSSPGGSIELAVWLQSAIACFDSGFNPKSTDAI